MGTGSCKLGVVNEKRTGVVSLGFFDFLFGTWIGLGMELGLWVGVCKLGFWILIF